MASIGVFSAMLAFSPFKANADQVTLQLKGTGGQVSGPGDVYPYYFSVDGSNTTTPLMCISYANEISVGESWKATIDPIVGTLDEEAAYIFSQAGISAVVSQWANWELFDSAAKSDVPSGDKTAVNNLLADAALYVKDNPTSSLYSEYVIYVPVSGSQSENGLPQNLIGAKPDLAPEPGSLVLCGSGLLGLALLVNRGRRLRGVPCTTTSRF
jgi:hypothetical protein